jgi:DNA (cytosine-5)-methyltransferase 1
MVVVKTVGALCARDFKGVGNQYVNEGKVIVSPVCVGNGQLHQISMSEQSNCLDCMHDQQAVLTSGKPPRKYIVRRLTPLECCRLQGFPDWWEDGVEGSDSARYKMWGNGMALPNMLHVMKGIARVEAMGRGCEGGAG